MTRARLGLLGAAPLAVLASPCSCGARGPLTVAERRAALQRRAAEGGAALPDLTRALDDERPLVRRQAARLLLEMGAPAKEALIGAMDNADLLVRRTALKTAWDLPTDEAIPYLAKGLKDDSVLVRHAAASHLAAIRPQTPSVRALLKQAGRDEDEGIRLIASKALWPFHKDTRSIRDDPNLDKDIQVVQRIPLPKDGWRFHLDPDRNGHEQGWFRPDFDDSGWKPIAIEQAWQKAGYDYIGVAWYRRWIELPPKPKHLAVELHFQGVDECAWVWLNGRYVGQHDIGPTGWDKPFRLDVTRELKWAQKNHITVRAMNMAHAGGIWRPVAIEVLE